MNGWQANGQPNIYAAAQGHLNPQSMYNNLGPNQPFDVNTFNQGLQQQNGAVAQNATPQPGQQFSTQPQSFTPASVVPAKRPHDGMAGSPSQQQQSRSQTPSYANFPTQQQQQFSNAPTPYHHLQQSGSNNATPSPTMSNQQFRPPQQPQQRMNNASPSPFPGQQQPGGASYGSPQPGTMQQQNNMAQFGQQYGMGPAMGMGGMARSMGGQMNNMPANMPADTNRRYQMQLLQQQQQLRATGMIPPRSVGGQPPNQMNNFGTQQPGAQMSNGQGANMQAQQQQQQLVLQKRQQFLKVLAGNAQQQGRPFNPTPSVGGKIVDLYTLWQVVSSAGGSATVDRNGQWPAVAMKLGFAPQQSQSAPDELKMIHARDIGTYERMWMQATMQRKSEQARVHAQQMAGYAGTQQQSPTKMMPQGQQTPFSSFQPGQQNQQQQGTPVQANASLPQNGMSTPQQMMGALHHRRTSSVRKPEQMTPQQLQRPGAMSPPTSLRQPRPPSAKQELAGPVMKSEELQSTKYTPLVRTIETDGGYDTQTLFELGNVISRAMPNHPNVDEMGVIDTKAITLSLASGIHSEVRYALDTLVILTHDGRVQLNLQQCEDLMDVIVDCAEEQSEILSEEAAEVSDALDLPAYEDLIRHAKNEAETLQEVPQFGSQAYELDRAAEKLVAITTILRNSSFYEFNHPLLTQTSLIKWVSNTIRLVGTRNMLLRTYYNTVDFFKDTIIYLSNITQSLELPSRDDALHLLHFLLAFAPQPSPSYTKSGGKIIFPSFVPANHRYLPPAVDSLAKLLARQDPNRTLYESIFTASSSSLAGTDSESPLDLLTRAFALAISVLPDRTKGTLGNSAQLRIVDLRKAYLTQGMLAADILTALAPAHEVDLARAWIESEDGWAVGLLNLTALLSSDRVTINAQKSRDAGQEAEVFGLITYRALTMMKRLAEKAGKNGGQEPERHRPGARGDKKLNGVVSNGDRADVDRVDDEEGEDRLGKQPKWEGIPQGHAILGALMMPNMNKVALGLLCGLHEMAMLQPNTS